MRNKCLGLFHRRELSAEERRGGFFEYLGSLEDRQIFLQNKVAAEHQKAIAFTNARNDNAALQCLKRMAWYEGQLDKFDKIHFSVSEKMAKCEDRITAEKAMGLSVDATKAMHKKTNIKEVDATVDEIKEQNEILRDVDDALINSIGDSVRFDSSRLDEDVLKAKLIELKAEVDVHPFYMPDT